MVFEKVRDILVEQLDVEEDKISMEASIIDDLGADSLEFLYGHGSSLWIYDPCAETQ